MADADTRHKRASVIGFALASCLVLPAPDTSVDAIDRVRLAYSYSGTDFTGVSGSATNDINAFAQSAAGEVEVFGTATNDINAFAQSAAGAVETTGTATSDINAFAQSATGTGTSEPAAETTATGGGRGSKRAKKTSRYPRRVVIDGQVYWVASAAEERRLLAEYQAKVEAEALELAITDAPVEVVAKAKVKVIKAAKRLEKVDTREDDWLQKLRDEDEIILVAVLH